MGNGSKKRARHTFRIFTVTVMASSLHESRYLMVYDPEHLTRPAASSFLDSVG